MSRRCGPIFRLEQNKFGLADRCSRNRSRSRPMLSKWSARDDSCSKRRRYHGPEAEPSVISSVTSTLAFFHYHFSRAGGFQEITREFASHEALQLLAITSLISRADCTTSERPGC